MLKLLHSFERFIIISIILLMMLTIFVSTIELGVILVRELMKPPQFLLDITNLLEVFGFFFMILIGIELLHTIQTYLTRDHLKVEIVFLVAMIAIARKVIILDLKVLNPVTILGMGVIILGLAVGYYLIRRVDSNYDKDGTDTYDKSY